MSGSGNHGLIIRAKFLSIKDLSGRRVRSLASNKEFGAIATIGSGVVCTIVSDGLKSIVIPDNNTIFAKGPPQSVNLRTIFLA